jgi:hypothetical protein
MAKKTESAIQRALVDWLTNNYRHVMVQATLNENSRNYMGMGCTVGIPDLIIFWRRFGVLQVLFLELKTKKGRLSNSQTGWKSAWYDSLLKEKNAHYAVAYGFSDAKNILEAVLCPNAITT